MRSAVSCALMLLAALVLALVIKSPASAEPLRVRLRPLAVSPMPPSRPPEMVGLRNGSLSNRADLLNRPIELSDARDRDITDRDQSAWRRMVGRLCTGCGGVGVNRVFTDPVAVLAGASSYVVHRVRRVFVRRQYAAYHPRHRRHHHRRRGIVWPVRS